MEGIKMADDKKKINFKRKFQDAVDATKEIDFSEAKEKIQKTANMAAENVKKIKMPEVDVKKIFKKKDVKEDSTKNNELKKENVMNDDMGALSIKAIPTRNAIKIFYYLMAADGKIFHNEEEKFDAIGKELDPDFVDHKEQIVKECQIQLDKVIDTEDYFDALREGVEDALLYMKTTDDTFITPKLLVWDLLTVAYSDEKYNEVERKLIKYIVRKTNIDKAIFLEMESSILTLIDIEKELDWIKTTNKQYLVIEAMVNELKDRRNAVFESVKDLIML